MDYSELNWPLMHNNITEDDRNVMIEFLKSDPILTNGPKVREFEEAWSKWLGVKHSVFVNSGASANLLTITYLAGKFNEVVVPSLTWVSDISSVLHNRLEPLFVDIDPYTLAMKQEDLPKNKVIFLTHVLGLVGCKPDFREEFFIEDCCESHGATYDDGSKVGTKGLISNFSFYFAHHMSTIEGGMICTDDELIYEIMRMYRSHGMVREVRNEALKKEWARAYPDVHPSFLFMMPGYNVRSTELNAVLGLNQLKRLDENIHHRKQNFEVFLEELSPTLYRTELATKGASPYGLIIIMKEPNVALRDKIERLFDACKVEYRRGLSGGGNQLRQPYLKHVKWKKEDYKEVEHVTDFSWYIGNYPGLDHKKIQQLCQYLNQF
jgi:CDP-6-deoxy-D-xylo-4-hexulose-3-dehydrase